MRRIVLPGHGTPTTFTPESDSTITVFTSGRRIPVMLKGGVRTRIEFVGSLPDKAAA